MSTTSKITVDTIVERFWANADRWANRPALRYHGEGDHWKVLTWADYGDAVLEVMGGLTALGVEAGDRVAILSNNRPEWHIADMATLSLGAATVPIYQTSPANQVAYVLQHSGAKVVVVEDHDQAGKVLQVRDELPELRSMVVIHCEDPFHDQPLVLTWDALRDTGRIEIAKRPKLRAEARAGIGPDTLATLVYTSGTTGPPKGTMITHGNIAWTLESVTSIVSIGPDDRFLSFLPLSHIAERIVSDFGQIVSGGETWFARSLTSVPDDLKACRPTIFFAVPRVWEKFQERVLEHVAEMHGAQKALVEEYLRLGRIVTGHREGHGFASLASRLEYDVLDKLVGSKIRTQMGLDKARIVVSAAAPISPELVRWFHGIGLRIAEVYGQTEDCGPATMNRPDAIRIGTVGTPLPGVQIRIAPDGEILVKGGSVCAGYWRNPEATAELIDLDGWMHSGDVGELDADGYLRITDRKKDLIITAAGQNVAPQQIETRLRMEPLIGQPVVVGDGRRYLTALITLDSQELAAWAEQHHKILDPEALAQDPDVIAEVQAAIDRVNKEFARVEGIKAFRILPREFTVASGELTPTLKVRRKAVHENHAALIENMYAEESA